MKLKKIKNNLDNDCFSHESTPNRRGLASTATQPFMLSRVLDGTRSACAWRPLELCAPEDEPLSGRTLKMPPAVLRALFAHCLDDALHGIRGWGAALHYDHHGSGPLCCRNHGVRRVR